MTGATTEYVGYIAMSLDGLIATPGGEVDWLSRYDELLRDALDFDGFLAGIDALLLGRRSLFVMPELLGGGTPCFPEGGRIAMRLIENRALPGGVMQLDYAPRRDKETTG